MTRDAGWYVQRVTSIQSITKLIQFQIKLQVKVSHQELTRVIDDLNPALSCALKISDAVLGKNLQTTEI